MTTNRYELNKNLAQMLKGGVIMDVTTPEQARIAEKAGACAFHPELTDNTRVPEYLLAMVKERKECYK